MSLELLKESNVRKRASAAVWQRGLAYFENGYVNDVVIRGDSHLVAEVEGSQYEPYVVEVQLDGDRIVSAECTCPYDFGGDCKHIIAALIFAVRKSEEVHETASVESLLKELDTAQLRNIIITLAKENPLLGDQIELLVKSVQLKPSGQTDAAVAATAPILFDKKILQRQIKADLKGSINHGYDQWGDSFHDSDLGVALEPACQLIDQAIEANQIDLALSILETATLAWDDGVGLLDDYIYEAFEDFAEEFTLELGECWANAILRADLSKALRLKYVDKLEAWCETMFGGGGLEIGLTAAIDGWDAPALVAAMNGTITDKGAWDDEAPFYADRLAEIRLEILAERGQTQAYLNLAQAEGQFLNYLTMLVQNGQVDLAIAQSEEFLSEHNDFLQVVKALETNNHMDRAIRLATHGLNSEQKYVTDNLAVWLRETTHRLKRTDMALIAARKALIFKGTLENYQALERIAGDRWQEMKPNALEIVGDVDSAENQVNIYLYEKMYDAAMQAVDKVSWYSHIEPVLEAVETHNPRWVFQQCRKRAEAIMDEGRAKDYEVAAEWLKRGRDVLLKGGLSAEWRTYINATLEKHRRKYKLVPLLRKIA